MNLIQEKRETIIREKNTAQETFETFLENIPNNSTELNVTIPLSGDLDLEVLSDKGFTKLKRITIGTEEMASNGTGELTNIRNIPTTLVYFSCINQLIVDIPMYSPYIEELHLENNHLTQMNLESMMTLKKLYLQNNELKEIHNLPKSLEELYIQNNQIKHLDLRLNENLKTLHCENNPGIALANIPASMVDLKMDETSDSTASYAFEETEESPNRSMLATQDYKEALKTYFKMKQTYEKKTLEMKRAAFARGKTKKQSQMLAKQVRPECAKCKRKVGMVFDMQNNRYIAMCGSKDKPCELKIELFRGDMDILYELLRFMETTVEDDKTKIIQQKMQTLFNYISEKESSVLFKSNLDTYNNDSATYKEILDKYNQIYNSEHNEELIKQKIITIYQLKDKMKEMQDEYLKSHNHRVIQEIMDIYVNEYMPEIQNLRTLKYKVMEMVEIPRDSEMYHLFQMENKLSDVEYFFGELPSVKTFQI